MDNQDFKYAQGWAIGQASLVNARLHVCRHPQGGWTVRESFPDSCFSLYRGSFASEYAANEELRVIQSHLVQEFLQQGRHQPKPEGVQLRLAGV